MQIKIVVNVEMEQLAGLVKYLNKAKIPMLESTFVNGKRTRHKPFTDAQKAELKKDYPKMTMPALKTKYGISASCIYRYVK